MTEAQIDMYLEQAEAGTLNILALTDEELQEVYRRKAESINLCEAEWFTIRDCAANHQVNCQCLRHKIPQLLEISAIELQCLRDNSLEEEFYVGPFEVKRNADL